MLMQAQVKQLVEVQHFGDAKNNTAILLYPRMTDKENFEKHILPCFKFAEDVADIKKALNM